MADTHDTPAAPAQQPPEATGTPLSAAFPELDSADAQAGIADTQAAPTQTGQTGQSTQAGRNIEAMLNVDLRVQIILGHARMPISQLLKLSRGSVIELDRRIGEPVDVVINDRLVARGDLIKLEGDRIGVTLTEIVRDYVSES